MKNIAPFFLLFMLFLQTAFTQEGLGIFETKWNVIVYDKGNVPAYAGNDLTADVIYSNADGTPIYSESHAGVLDDNSFVSFIIGAGTNQQPNPLNEAIYKSIATFSWTITVQTADGPKIITGTDELKPGLWSTYARVSQDSEGLGGKKFVSQPHTFGEVFNMADDPAWSFLLQRNTDIPATSSTIITFPFREFIEYGNSKSKVTKEEIPIVRFGKNHRSGFDEDCYYFWGPEIPEETSSYYTFCRPYLRRVNHLVEFKLNNQVHPPGLPPRDANHNTAVIYAENNSPGLSAGVLASAGTWGVYANGQNGVVGITSGEGNGAGLTGFVGTPPVENGFKYGAYANSNGLADTWAAAIFGSGFYTGTWMLASDARLKKEIRAQTNTLDKVMQLRPSSYYYRTDTPYGFTEGLHHGFIAQEVETVMPELVAPIKLPKDMDPEKMHLSGSEEYKAINYTEMISILTSALQEMNTKYADALHEHATQIEKLNQRIAALEEK